MVLGMRNLLGRLVVTDWKVCSISSRSSKCASLQLWISAEYNFVSMVSARYFGLILPVVFSYYAVDGRNLEPKTTSIVAPCELSLKSTPHLFVVRNSFVRRKRCIVQKFCSRKGFCSYWISRSTIMCRPELKLKEIFSFWKKENISSSSTAEVCSASRADFGRQCAIRWYGTSTVRSSMLKLTFAISCVSARFSQENRKSRGVDERTRTDRRS